MLSFWEADSANQGSVIVEITFLRMSGFVARISGAVAPDAMSWNIFLSGRSFFEGGEPW